jgi:type II secretory pathway pseudopilin PulG
MRLRRVEGFTLMEILIALGLFALAVSGLLVLFPVAQRTEREGTEELRAALIAGSIMDSLCLSPSNGMVALANGITNGVPVWNFLNPKITTNQSVAYTSSCDPLFPLGVEETAHPLRNPQAVAIATLRLSQKPSLPCLIIAEVEVSSPASAPPENRTARRFVKLIPDIPHGCDSTNH